MKIALEWLREFVSCPWPASRLADELIMAGLEAGVFQEGKKGAVILSATPNRGDTLSVLGTAREVAALQGKSLKPCLIKAPKGSKNIKKLLIVKVKDTQSCPRYMARVIEGVRVAPSPKLIQERLIEAGIRPVNNVVDATNFVMLERGQPLHAFDYRFLSGGEIVVRKEKGEKKFKTLDGRDQRCEANDLFICDKKGPVALAGIMGGADSQVRDDTTCVVLEAAYFDPVLIHRSAKRLKIKTESSYRFERGVDPNGVEPALHRVTELILQTAGGTPSWDWTDIYPKKIRPRTVRLHLAEVKRILGFAIPTQEIKRLLFCLGLAPTLKGKTLSVKVPTYRFDLLSDVDILEEIARLKGYEHVPTTLPKIAMGLPCEAADAEAEVAALSLLSCHGFSEGIHLNFTDQEKATRFNVLSKEFVKVANPLSEDQGVLRPTLMPGLLDGVRFNLHRQRKSLKLFELRKVFSLNKGKIEEKKHLGLVAVGPEWVSPWPLPSREVDFFTLKGVIADLSEHFRVPDLRFSSNTLHLFLVASHSATLWKGNAKIGWLGLLSPDVTRIWGIDEDVYAMEIDWELFLSLGKKERIQFRSISKFPHVERDLALVVDNALEVGQLEETIRNMKNPWIQKVQLFDIFIGGNLPKNKKSVALNICYRTPDRTLTNEEVNAAHEGVINRLTQAFSAQLRK